MIEKYMKDELQKVIPDLEWTINNYTAEDNTGTVYSEGGEPPDIYDTEYRFPEYMVYFRSSNWGFVEQAAQQALLALNKRINFYVTTNSIDFQGNVIGQVTYHVIFLEATSDVIRIGINDNGLMEYSVNFRATLRRIQ